MTATSFPEPQCIYRGPVHATEDMQAYLSESQECRYCAIDALRSAQDIIKRKGQVKPGWTDADHDAYWMLRKREEQLMTELGIEFYSLLTGPFSPENIL